MKRDFREEAKKTREFIITLAKELIRCKTVNYNRDDYPEGGPDGMESPGQESKAVAVLVRYLEKLGVSYKIYEKIKHRGNLITSIGMRRPNYRKLLVLLHTDVVPSGGRHLWKYDPFEPVVKDGMLYGRGAADNKGQLASVISSFFMLQEFEHLINGEFIVGALSDEEVGIEKAGFEVVDEELNFGSFVTDAIVPDTSGNNIEIERAEKGRIIIKVSVYGKQAHASMPWRGANAIYAFSDFSTRIEKHKFHYTTHHLLGEPTVNLGMIKGGSAPNTVAAFCEALFDVRTVPFMSDEGVLREFRRVSERVNRNDIRFNVKIVQSSAPTEVPEDAEIIKTIKKYVPEAKTKGIGGITFCKPLVNRGIDAVGWSPGSEDVVHMADECISIDELVDFSGLLAEVAFDICNQKIEKQ
ncbi:MAG: M20 family peptidase [Nitrospirae bacterium]|nr:MAG: M20 family peptidase [Nitrospirota bacterium]